MSVNRFDQWNQARKRRKKNGIGTNKVFIIIRKKLDIFPQYFIRAMFDGLSIVMDASIGVSFLGAFIKLFSSIFY